MFMARGFFYMVQQPTLVRDNFIVVASKLHSETLHSVGLLWTSDQLVADTST